MAGAIGLAGFFCSAVLTFVGFSMNMGRPAWWERLIGSISIVGGGMIFLTLPQIVAWATK